MCEVVASCKSELRNDIDIAVLRSLRNEPDDDYPWSTILNNITEIIHDHETSIYNHY